MKYTIAQTRSILSKDRQRKLTARLGRVPTTEERIEDWKQEQDNARLQTILETHGAAATD